LKSNRTELIRYRAPSDVDARQSLGQLAQLRRFVALTVRIQATSRRSDAGAAGNPGGDAPVETRNAVITGWDAMDRPTRIHAWPAIDDTVLVVGPPGGFRIAGAGVDALSGMVDPSPVDDGADEDDARPVVDGLEVGGVEFRALAGAEVVARRPGLAPLVEVADSPWEFR
jgi:hypothetical protein